jgi:hypothetical protein
MKVVMMLALVALVSGLGGCATLGIGGGGGGSDTDPSLDPIAAAAAQVRDSGSHDWGASAGDTATEEDHEYHIQRALTQREITTGMSMNQVRDVWGEPRDVEQAGDSYQGNQKWVYYDGLSSRWSVSGSRVVYFEGGHVVGWERGQN